MKHTLAIDSGNSNIKWGLFSGNVLLKSQCIPCQNAALLESEFLRLPELATIIVSHVGRKGTRHEIAELLVTRSERIYWLRASEVQCGVHNGYADPHQLGSDRWAALIAAWNLSHRSCLVINVGTALTVDLLSDSGEHLGGIIAPSAHLMIKSLSCETQLPYIESGMFDNFPSNTVDAIYTGAIQMMLGTIDRMFGLSANEVNHTDMKCIISGGGAHVIVPYLKHPYEYVDYLVLHGLALIAQEIRDNQIL